jgi:hypothetical protein
MSDSDEKPFSVTDRRHFTADGRPREEDEEKTAPAATPANAAAPDSEGPVAESATPEPPPGEEADRRPQTRAAGGPVEFREFLLSLGAQAGLLLSGGGEGGGEDEAAALEGARQIIGILEMLHDKTEGRRTGEETRVLEDMLFQLRMAFVERSRATKR